MKQYIFIFISAMVLFACNKTKVDAPTDFSVTTSQTTYSVRDTVTFNFTGQPDYITFYSGEPHSKYADANITSMAADSNILAFSTVTTAPSTTTQPASTNNFTMLASINFSGIYDSANIKKATWTDISSRAALATTTTTVASGNIHVEDLKTKGDTSSLYLAFKYVADTAKTNYLSRLWTVSALSIKNYFKDTAYALATSFTTGGFYAVNVLNNINTWTYNNVSSITTSFTFKAPAVGSLPDEDWIVSRPLNLSTYPPDLGIQIKTLSDTHLTQYRMTRAFKAAGTYLVTFVAKNQASDNSEQVVKQISLIITP